MRKPPKGGCWYFLFEDYSVTYLDFCGLSVLMGIHLYALGEIVMKPILNELIRIRELLEKKSNY